MDLSNQMSEYSEESLNDFNNDIHDLKLIWGNNFKEILNQLSQILSLSDEQFDSISHNLQSFNYDIKDISNKALDVANSFSGEHYTHIIDNLKSIYNFIIEYIDSSNNQFNESEDSFLKIVSYLENIVNDSLAFKKLVKHLDAQGISIKIESARLGNDDKGFKVIAENINNLSVLISNKSQGFRDKSKSLIETINSARYEIISLQKHQQKYSNSILNSTENSLKSLVKKNELSSEEIGVIHKKSENIKHEVGSLVTSIQFHDITRQQIEHVNSVIQNLIEKIELKNDDKPSDHNKGLIVYIHEAAKVQSAQLTNSKNELNKAALNIISNLEAIKKDVSGIAGEILSLMENSENSNETFIGKVDTGFNEILTTLSKDKDISNEFYNTINSVADTINDLSMFINEIGSIGSEIELISLNASIKAAHTGREGAALGVLAEATQKLSVQSKNDTDAVIKMLVSVWEVSQKLQKNAENKSNQDGKKRLESISSDIENIFSSLRLISENAINYLMIIRQNSIKIESSIENAIVSLRTYLEIDEKINNIIDELNDVVNSSEIQIAEHKINKNELEDLGNNYTMKIQRDIHQSVSIGDLQNDIFDDEKTGSAIEEKSGNEFGDNVDLF